METKIFKSYREFKNRENKSINGVSEGFVKRNSNYVEQNKTNKGCWNCKHCEFCEHCNDCENIRWVLNKY